MTIFITKGNPLPVFVTDRCHCCTRRSTCSCRYENGELEEFCEAHFGYEMGTGQAAIGAVAFREQSADVREHFEEDFEFVPVGEG